MTTAQPPGHYIDLTTRDGSRVRSFIVEPRKEPRGVAVLLQHMDQRHPDREAARRQAPAGGGHRPGVNPHVRHMCEAFAEHGYLAIAPSTFGRGVSGLDYGFRRENTYWGSRMVLPLEPVPSPAVMIDIEAAILHARRVAPNLGIGLVGYCWGGLLAWRGASEFKAIDAVACHYPGGIDSEHDVALQPRCPVLAHFASDGKWMSRAGVQAFIDAQSNAPAREDGAPAPAVETHVYPASYGFMQRQHVAYDDSQARLAQQRTLRFLDTHLKIR